MEVKIAEAAPPSFPTVAVSKALIAPSEAIRRLRYPERKKSAARDKAFAWRVASSKAAAVKSRDQQSAKLFWIAQAIAQAQRTFEKSFELMKRYKFYEAWCELERCEIVVASLRRHFPISAEDAHRIAFIQTMVERWQALFPYNIFFSPEILKEHVECSTCGTRLSLRNPCGHEKGEIYDGEECHHRIVACKLLSISAVRSPVQKYSVAFVSSEDGSRSKDQYDYAIVRFAIDRLTSPYHAWQQEEQLRTVPIADFAHLPLESCCPCGSGEPFSGCCSRKHEVIVPHCQFFFSVAPPSGLPEKQLNV